MTPALGSPADTAGGTPEPKADPCALVTKAEVSEVLGAPVEDGKSSSGHCFFNGGAKGAVQVSLMDNVLGETAEQTVARLRKDGKKVEVVQGFGDSAYRMAGAYGATPLCAYQGSKQVIVTTMAITPPEKADAVTEQLMLKALGRLKPPDG